MSKRFEFKYRLEKWELGELFVWLKTNRATQLFPKRKISSLYFDTSDFEFHRLTREGVIPRSKVRIRCYGGHLVNCDEHFLEIKTSNENSRNKSTTLFNSWEKTLKSGLFLPNFQPLIPAIRITYERDYFDVNGFRLTLDREIHYTISEFSYQSSQNILDQEVAMEVKAPIGASLDDLNNLFSFQKRQFSKYERGIDTFSEILMPIFQ